MTMFQSLNRDSVKWSLDCITLTLQSHHVSIPQPRFCEVELK